MSDSTEQHPAGVYVKGSQSVVAQSSARAVALVFDGYTLAKVDDSIVAHDGEQIDTDYRDLQKQAKELDIPANQSAEDLRKQIDAKLND